MLKLWKCNFAKYRCGGRILGRTFVTKSSPHGPRKLQPILFSALKRLPIFGLVCYGALVLVNLFSKNNYLVLRRGATGTPRLILREQKKPAELLRNRVKSTLVQLILEALNDRAVFAESTVFVQKVFVHPKTQEAGITLLLNVLQSAQFTGKINQFSLDLLLSILNNPAFQQDLQIALLGTLKNEELRAESLKILRYVVAQQESKDLIADLFREVFVREDMIASVKNILAVSGFRALTMKVTEDKFVSFLVRAANSPEIKKQIYALVLAPFRQFISFGIY